MRASPATVARVIGTIGDLVEDIVVRLGGPVNEASDTDAVVVRRRGGSAANFAASVARCGHPSRFIGQVGDDVVGAALLETLAGHGVEVMARRGGRTGTIIVLLDHHGERTMLTDRGACALLADPDPAWLDGLSTLHVPVYSLVGEPLATTTATLVAWAHERSIRVSIDASSASVIESFGATRLRELLAELRPDVLLCNELELATLGAIEPTDIGADVVVIKHGGGPAVVHRADGPPAAVPAEDVRDVRDTTGAGDAFAAGLLVALAGDPDPVAAARAGHVSAARAITAVSGDA